LSKNRRGSSGRKRIHDWGRLPYLQPTDLFPVRG